MMQLVPAHEGHALQEIRKPFEEYAASVGISLNLQGFDDEMRNLPGDYAPVDPYRYHSIVGTRFMELTL